MLSEILSHNIFHFLFVFTRLSGFFIIAPGFSAPYVNMQSRLVLALAVSLVMFLPISDAGLLPVVPTQATILILQLGGEFLIGAFMAGIMIAIMAALHTAGTIVAFTSALANAMAFDPISQGQSALVSSFLSAIGLLLVFITDLHHMMFRALFDSYTLFAPGVVPPIDDMAEMFTRTVSQSFTMGVQLAGPFIILSFGFQVTVGVLNRLTPQIQVFFVAMPLQIALSLVMLGITLTGIMIPFLSYFQGGLGAFLVKGG